MLNGVFLFVHFCTYVDGLFHSFYFLFFLVNSAMDLFVMTSLELDWPHIVYFYFYFDRNL